MKKIFLATLILISLGCKKNPEKFLLKSDSTWSFNCESKSYDKNSVLLSTTNYSYELIFESKTSGKYRKLNSNDSYKSFACEFVKGFIVGCKLDIKFENAGSFNLNFDKVKKKRCGSLKLQIQVLIFLVQVILM